MGDRWLGLNARGTYGTTYGIHGNNNESSIGSYVSSGCIRMKNAEVRWLFDQVHLHTKVIILQSSSTFDQLAVINGYKFYETPLEKAERLVAEAESYAGALKWAISFEGSADGRTRPSTIYGNTRNAMIEAEKAINALSSARRAAIRPRLDNNVKKYVNRAMRYNDAIVSGVKLENKRITLEKELQRNVVDDRLKNAYDEVTSELRKQQRLSSLVYGFSTRNIIREMYESPASLVHQNSTYIIGVYNELRRYEVFLNANDFSNVKRSEGNIEEWLTLIPYKHHRQQLTSQFINLQSSNQQVNLYVEEDLINSSNPLEANYED